MKKIFCCLLAALLLPIPSRAATIYENTESSTITKGVTYKKIETFSESGWTRANVMEIDLSEPNASVRVLTSPEGSGRLSTVKQMASSAGAKAAVNGDFFNFASGETNMLGMVYSEGELISTPAKDRLPSFVLTEENRVLFDVFDFSGMLIAENTSLCEYSTCELYQINKVPLTTGEITMITSAWGESVFVPAYCYAMVTEPTQTENEYRMCNFSWGGESVSIPDGGAVFIAAYEINGFLNVNFAMGDVIRVEAEITPDVGKIKEASGGSTVLVRDGQVAEFTLNITGNNPRTAMGLSNSGSTLVLVTIDGRESDCAGMTQTELAEFMIALGCEDAINFDGGGSTTMVTENRFTGALEVKNSVSSQRKVSTSVGVFSQAEYTGKVSGGEIALSSETLVPGGSVEVYCAFYDENYNNVYYSVEDVDYYCNDAGAVYEGNKITLSSPGIYSITASYGGVTLEKKIEVIDDIFAVNIYPEVASTAEKDVSFIVTAYSRSGKSAQIPTELVSFAKEGDVALEGNTAKLGSGSGTVTAMYKNLTSVAAVNAAKYERPNDNKERDKFEGEIEGALNVTVVGKLSPKKSIGRFAVNKSLFAISGRDIYALSPISDPAGILNFYRAVNGFTERTIENTKIITVANTASSSFRLTDSSAWGKLKSVCENLSQQNLIIMTNDAVYKMNDGEQEVFYSFVEKLAEEGKNVFVVSNGEKSEVTVSRGVRYIYLGPAEDISTASYEYDMNANKFVKFYFSGSDISYSFE